MTSECRVFYDAVALISYLIIVPVVLSATPLIELLFGVEYADSAPILAGAYLGLLCLFRLAWLGANGWSQRILLALRCLLLSWVLSRT